MTLGFLLSFGESFAVSPFTIILTAILVVASLATRARPSFAGLAAIFLYVTSYLLANSWKLVAVYGGERELAVQLYQLAAFDVIGIQAWLIWYLVRRPDRLHQGDLIAQLYWTVYMFAEISQIAEYLGCKMLYDPWMATELAKAWGNEAANSACERAFGPWARQVLPFITTLFLAWPAYRAYQLWRAEPRR